MWASQRQGGLPGDCMPRAVLVNLCAPLSLFAAELTNRECSSPETGVRCIDHPNWSKILYACG